jgi:hypothetical protein
MDYLLARGRARWQEWARRYIPFGAVWSGYLFIEWYISQQSRASAIYRGYALDARIVGNTIEYLTRLAFPWALDAPLDYAWLIVCATVFFAALWKSKSAALAFLGLAGVIGFLPFVPFYKTETRFFYASTIVSALWLALLSEHALARLSRSFAFSRLCAFLASSALALIVVGNSLAIADRASALTDLARLSRAPLRAVSQRHPTLPPDTLV